MQTMLGIIPALSLLALALLHAYWALGGKKGLDDALPQRDGRVISYPPPLVIWAVALGLLLCVMVVLGRIGYWGVLPDSLVSIGSWALAGIFLFRGIGDFKYMGVFKKVRDTRFARLDSLFYSPFSFFMSFCLSAISVT